MTPSEVASVVGNVGFMTPERGKILTDFIHKHRITKALELGFAHGVSTCYIAAAVAERGGSVCSIDLEVAHQRSPSAQELLAKCGFSNTVSLFYEPTCYTWRLMKMLESDKPIQFDFCFIDGAHNWFTDGFAFFLVDRLLAKGGWLIFDDYYWTYATSPTLRDTDIVRKMPIEEQTIAQVGKVYDLLVKNHQNYGEFLVQDDWAYARKGA